jgi:phosphoglycerate dehydrogenase-like enzyme
MTKPSVAILDDTQNVAASSADWRRLDGRADFTILQRPFASEDDTAETLAPFDIVVMMRERTAFTASLVARLPRLRMIALTGARAPTLDISACTARGILICNTAGDRVTPATSELAFGLILACARRIPEADAAMKHGGWHNGLGTGFSLAGKTLGIAGLGRLGTKVAGFGKAFGMDVIAWSQNLTDETAAAAGCRRVSKEALFETADAISLHLVLSDRTRGVVGPRELAAMKPDAILVNTSRGPLIDEPALLAALNTGRLRAGLDVFDREPLPADHPLRKAPNVILTPHLGYSTGAAFQQFYGESLENIEAFLSDAPIRMVNPEVRTAAKA